MLVSPHASRPGCSWHLEGERVGRRACIPLLVGGPATLQGGAPRLVDPQILWAPKSDVIRCRLPFQAPMEWLMV